MPVIHTGMQDELKLFEGEATLKAGKQAYGIFNYKYRHDCVNV